MSVPNKGPTPNIRDLATKRTRLTTNERNVDTITVAMPVWRPTARPRATDQERNAATKCANKRRSSFHHHTFSGASDEMASKPIMVSQLYCAWV